MDELIPDKKRDEMPRKWRADGTNLKVREADEHLHTDGRKALLPKVVWPDVQPSLQSRLMDHLVLLTGRRKWWASATVVQERARRLREVIETVGVQNVTVIGNSAGGGLSLAAAQWLREAGHPQPNALILIDSGA
jgi:pimeloyl-ACP methyl ester carboxylesterase